MSEPTQIGLTVQQQLGPVNLARASPGALREDMTQRREAAWHAACQLGRCRFTGLPRDASDEPGWVDSTNTCGGYHGSRELEPDVFGTPSMVPVWRWRPCQRQVRWRLESGKLRAAARQSFAQRRRGGAAREEWES